MGVGGWKSSLLWWWGRGDKWWIGMVPRPRLEYRHAPAPAPAPGRGGGHWGDADHLLLLGRRPTMQLFQQSSPHPT